VKIIRGSPIDSISACAAGISFDLSDTSTCPSTIKSSWSKADTSCRAGVSSTRDALPRRALPSIAMNRRPDGGEVSPCAWVRIADSSSASSISNKNRLIPTQLGTLRQLVPNNWFNCSSRSSTKASIFLSEVAPASIDNTTAHSSGSSP